MLPTPNATRSTATPDGGQVTLGQAGTAEQAAFDALRAWSRSDQVGVPFGPGLGLEEAVAVVRQYLSHPSYLRRCGSGVIRVAGHDIGMGGISFDDWDRILGHQRDTFRRQGLSKRHLLACVDSVRQAKAVLVQFLEQEGPVFRQWQRDDALAAEAYTWHVVTACRLTEAGLTDHSKALVGDLVIDDSNLSDPEWLHAGYQRYERLIPRHYGSPETIAAGGDERRQSGDLATALFFFQKAIDLLHTHYDYLEMKQRRPSEADSPIIDDYVAALSEVRRVRPQAAVAASVKEATHRLRTISTTCRGAGLDPGQYLSALDRLAQIAPDVDSSGFFWKNPSMREALGDDFPLPPGSPENHDRSGRRRVHAD